MFVGLGKHIERQEAAEGEFQLCDNGAGAKELKDEDPGGLLGHDDCYEMNPSRQCHYRTVDDFRTASIKPSTSLPMV